MRSFWTIRRLATFSVISLLFSIQTAVGQKGGGAGAGGGANLGSSSRSSVPNSSLPNFGNTPSTNTPGSTRPIFLSGKVIFDDGSKPTPDIRIERVCGGSIRLEGHTDTKGRFSLQLGQEPMAFADASDTPPDGFNTPSGQSNSNLGYGRSTGSTSGSSTANPLWNCELRAGYPGFRSDVIDLSTRRTLDNPDVGTIVLHRLVNVQGSTISLTTELAPKQAQKAYQKGLQAAQKAKLDEAEQDFTRATNAYPKYAIAWFALGQMQQREGKTDLARKSYIAATTADNKYLSPYDQLAHLSVQESKWEEAADYSKHVIELNSVEFPSSFWYNAVANYQLHKPGEAEKSIAELLKLDTQHHFPEAERLMAQLLLDKGKYPEAGAHLRAYLALVPAAKNADSLKAILLEIDEATARTRPPQ